jgi:hypothetical protein
MSDSNDNNTPETTEEEQTQQEETLVVKMSDDLIAIIRELVQLSILTGTNIVDHFRAITCEIDAKTSRLVPTEEYVEAYNVMVDQLVKQAEEARAQQEEEIKNAATKEDLEAGVFAASVIKDEKELN